MTVIGWTCLRKKDTWQDGVYADFRTLGTRQTTSKVEGGALGDGIGKAASTRILTLPADRRQFR
jgi:hypothetical protein